MLYKNVAYYVLILLSLVAVGSLASANFRKKRFNMKWSMWVAAFVIVIQLIVCCILAIVSACTCLLSSSLFFSFLTSSLLSRLLFSQLILSCSSRPLTHSDYCHKLHTHTLSYTHSLTHTHTHTCTQTSSLSHMHIHTHSLSTQIFPAIARICSPTPTSNFIEMLRVDSSFRINAMYYTSCTGTYVVCTV